MRLPRGRRVVKLNGGERRKVDGTVKLHLTLHAVNFTSRQAVNLTQSNPAVNLTPPGVKFTARILPTHKLCEVVVNDKPYLGTVSVSAMGGPKQVLA